MRLNDIRSGLIVNNISLDPRNTAILWIPDILTPYISSLSLFSWNIINVHTLFLPPTVSIIKAWSLQKYNKELKQNKVIDLQHIATPSTFVSNRRSFIWDTNPLYKVVDLQYGNTYNISTHKKFSSYLVNWFSETFNTFTNKWIFFLTTSYDWQQDSNVNVSSMIKHRVFNLFSMLKGSYSSILHENTFQAITKVNGIMLGVYNDSHRKTSWFCVQKDNNLMVTKIFSFLNAKIDKEDLKDKETKIDSKNSLSNLANLKKDDLKELNNIKEKHIIDHKKYEVIKRNLSDDIPILNNIDNKLIINSLNIFANDNPNDQDVKTLVNTQKIIDKSISLSLLSKSINYTLHNYIDLNILDAKDLQKLIKTNKILLKEKLSGEVYSIPGSNIKFTTQLLIRKQEILKEKLNALVKDYDVCGIQILSVTKSPVKSNDVAHNDIERWTYNVRDLEAKKTYKISFDVPVIKNDKIFYNGNYWIIRHKFLPKLITNPKPFLTSYYGPLINFYILVKNIRGKDMFYFKWGSHNTPLLPLLFAIYPPKEVLDYFKIKFDSVVKEDTIIKNKESSIHFYVDNNFQQNLINSLTSIPKTGNLMESSTWSSHLNDINKDHSFVSRIYFHLKLTQEHKTQLYMSSIHRKSDIMSILFYMCELAISSRSNISTDVSSLNLVTFNWDDIILKNIISSIFTNRIRLSLGLQTLSVPTNTLIRTLLLEGYITYSSSLNPISNLSNLTSTSFLHIGSMAPFIYRDFYDNSKGVIDPIDTPSGDNVGITQRFTIGTYVTGNGEVSTLNKYYPFGWAVSTIPFARFNDGNRLQMAANHVRQATPLLYGENALIQTGIESFLEKVSLYKILAECDGKIEKLNDYEIIVKCNSSSKRYTYSIIPLPIATNYLLHWQLLCKKSQEIKIGDVLAQGEEFHSRGSLTMGVNLYTIYINSPWTYEDAIIISENVTDKLISSGGAKVVIKIFENQSILKLCNINSKLYRGDPIIVIGGNVKDISDTMDDWQHQDILYTLENNKSFYISSKTMRVVDIKIHATKKIYEKNKLLKERWNQQLERIKDVSIYDNIGLKELVDTLTYKGIKVNAVIEFNLEWNDSCILGTKLTNRHGNKGVISKILPINEMPKDDNGKPFDLILNPSGLFSRKNIGQMYELYLSNLAYYINENIYKMRKENVSEKQIVTWFVNIYSKLDHTKDKILLKMALSHLYKGDIIPIYVPPFNELTFTQMKELLTTYKIDYQTFLHYNDGSKSMTKVPKGYLYIYKLYHEPFEKESARAIGSYTPLGHATAGRTRMGGQKIDEQTTWALASYEVPNLLREMFTVSSVDIDSKKRAWTQIIKSGYVSFKELPIKSYSKEYLQCILSSMGFNYL